MFVAVRPAKEATVSWILGSGLRFGRLVVALAIGLTVIGIAQLRSAPVDVYPEFMPPSVEIQTEALGLSAAEVEQLITVPLEQDLLNGVPWLDRIHSSSMPGLSAIDMTFQAGTDIYAARQMVQERMTQAHALPNVGSPPIMIQPLASASRIAMIKLSSSQVSAIDMSVLARWKLRPRLMGVHGVANVSVYGQRDRQLQVQVDPERLRAEHVSLTQVIETAGNALWVSPLTFVEASTPGTGGFFESASQRLGVQHISPISTPQQLSAVPVQDTKAGQLRLGDVANVIEDHQPLIGDAVPSGSPSLFLVIEKFPGADTLRLTRDVEHAMADMAPGLKGITIDTSDYRPATFVETALRNIGWVTIIGFALLLAVMLIVFASWRAALIGAVVLPTSLTLAAYVLYLQGTTFTTITLLGLAAAVCVLVDDVITDIDAARRQAAEPDPAAAGPAGGTVKAAFSAVRGPLLFATVATLLATLPFLFLGTVVTAFSRPLVLAFALAVLSSMVVSLLLTPTLAVLLLRGRGARRPDPFARWSKRIFDRGFAVIRSPRRAWALAGMLLVALLAVIPLADHGSMLPPLQDRNLLLHVEALPGTSLSEMDRITATAGQELRALPGVKNVGAHVGRAVGSDQLVDVNSAEVWITLDDHVDYARTRAAVTAVMRGYPGLRTDLVTYPGDRVSQLLAGQRDDLVVRVYGADLTVLQRKAHEVQAMLSRVPGVAHPVMRPVPERPTVTVKVNLAAAERYGLRPGDIRRDATTLTSGLIVGNLYEQSKIFDVVVWGAPHARSDLSELGNMLIDTPGGGHVALRDVATVAVRAEPDAIIHDDVLRSVEVAARVTGDPSAVASAVHSRLAAMPMPYEYHAEVFSNATTRHADAVRGLVYGAVALVGVFLLLQAAVANWRRAALMLASLPLSVLGGVLTALLAGGIWDAASLTGLFAVMALTLRASVLLGRRLHVSEETGAEAETAARERVVPIAQTVLATAALLLPAAIVSVGPGLEFLHPLAVTMLGGLVSLLLVQGFLLPALLLATDRSTVRQERTPPDAAGRPAAGPPPHLADSPQ
jgi:Cu/Ag efflux pump CusA